jgi:type 1 glutamine amidotransferase
MNQTIVSLCLTIILLPEIMQGQIIWTRHTISDSFDGACSVHAQDINGDSMTDVVGAGWALNTIALWINDGGNPIVWTEQQIDTSFYGASFVFAEDVNSDGHIDILASAWSSCELAWWENSGTNPITWTKHSIDAAFYNAHEITAADMDNDGDMDVLGAAALTDEIAWFENNGLSPITWTKHLVDDDFDGARSVKAVDIDGDGLLDVAGAALLANRVTWWRNNGDTTWTEYPIDSTFGMSHMVYSRDIDADGDSDIVAAAYTSNAIAWWRNDGGTPIQWTKQTIDGSFLGALGVYVKDINNDNHLDILGTADITDDVAWWSSDGHVPINWTKAIIHGTCNGAWPVYAEDIDGDGDNDVLAAANGSNAIYWYENDLLGINENGKVSFKVPQLGATIIRGPIVIRQGIDFSILDISGRRVTHNELVPGVYFVQKDGIICQKMIKIQ